MLNSIEDMSSSCNLSTRKLREKNRLLLDQLESNSILLESRLKKLKHSTRTTKLSNKTRKCQPHTALKRKHEPWRTRNYSGQVPTAMNATVYNCSCCSTENLDACSKAKQRTEDTSPAKRSKQNVIIVSRCKDKSVKSNPRKCSPVTKSKNYIYDCTDDSDELASKEEIYFDLSSKEELKSLSPVQHCSRHKKFSELVEKAGILDNEQQRRTLEAAHSIINYSPKSVFLQRLKERSQALDDLTASGNLRIMSKPSSVIVCKKSPHPVKKVVKSNFKKTLKNKSEGSCEKQVYTKSLNSPKSDIKKDENIRPSLQIQQNVKDDFLLRGLKKNENRKPKKIKRRTCYRKYCYCRTPQNIEVGKSYTSVLKENIKESKKDLSDLKNSPSGHCKCCEEINSRTSLCTSAVASDLEKNEQNKSVHSQRSCTKGSHWFERLNEFRQSHWFDCHAHPQGSDISSDSVRHLKKGVGFPSDHKCIHKFALDDRLFVKPLNADHRNNCCCVACNLHGSESRLRNRASSAITLPSRYSEVQVSIPAKSFCGIQQCPAVLLQKKGKSHYNTRTKSQSSQVTENVKPRIPPPTDSLALRFQKGIAK